MFRGVKGYFSTNGIIKDHLYYIISLKTTRKACLIKMACKTEKLARQYIICHLRPELFDIIIGTKAIDRGLKFLANAATTGQPYTSKYWYPPGLPRKKRRQYRETCRQLAHKAKKRVHLLKQYTLRHKGRVFTTHHTNPERAYDYIKKHTRKLTYKSFIKRVDTTPREVTKDLVFIKSNYISFELINLFNEINNVKAIYRKPNSGRVPPRKIALFSDTGRKPKSLVF